MDHIPRTHLILESDKGPLALLKPKFIFRMDLVNFFGKSPILNYITDQAM